MRIMFMGTSDFAAVCLNALVSDKNSTVTAVVSQPDMPKGRGHKLKPTPVKEAAEANQLTVYQPEKLKDGEFEEILKKEDPELIVVVAYGKILPEYILNYPKYGCINVHASLLPRWRGAAPIQWSILSGDKETGITVMYMEKGLDTGDMIMKEKTPIGDNETSEELFERLADMGGKLLLKVLPLIEGGLASAEAQDDTKSTYASKIEKSMAKIDWSDGREKIKNLVRAMNSWPYAYTYYNGKVMKIGECEISDEKYDAPVGTIVKIERKKGIFISCGDGTVCAKTVQFEGSKMMKVTDYLAGHSIDEGVVLGN